MTAFCHATVPLWGDLEFHVDGNSKITRDNGTFADPRPNAFSLPHVATCPGSTARCRASCYVHGLRKHAPEVYETYEQNERALLAVLADSGSARAAAYLLGEWIKENAPGGFRWHVSGDVMSADHAAWISSVCRQAPDAPFWIYTRSLFAVPNLRAKNLAVNVSADRDNYDRAIEVAEAFEARLCYLVSSADEAIPELPAGSVIFPDYPLRGRSLPVANQAPWWLGLSVEQKRMVCPADFYGQSEEHRCGPCKHCLGATS